MYKTIKYLLLVFVLSCIGSVIKADNLRLISGHEGISNSAVVSLAQDGNGMIWVGTCEGLNVWDGTVMKLFNEGRVGAGRLSGNLVEEIRPTSDSLFWIRSDYGLDLLDPRSCKVENHPQFQGLYRFVTGSHDQTFVVTSSGLQLYYNSRLRDFVEMNPIPFSEFEDLLELHLSHNGVLWLFSRKGIYSFRINYSSTGLPSFDVNSKLDLPSAPQFAYSRAGNVCFVDNSGILYEMNFSTGKPEYVMDVSEQLSKRGALSCIIKDGDGYVLSFLTDGAVRVVSSPQKKERFMIERIHISCGVMSLLKDENQDIVWLGTDGRGLGKLTRNAVSFSSVTFNELPFGLSKPVRALCIDKYRNFWMGTKGEGLIFCQDFDPDSPLSDLQIKHWTTANSGLTDNSVYAFEPSARNLLWIGSDTRGLDYYSYRDKQIRHLPVSEDMRYVHAIYEHQKDTLYIASVGCGVFKLVLRGSDDNPVVESVEKLYFNDELKTRQFFFDLSECHDGKLWFGNRGGGAVKYDIKTGQSEVVKFDAPGFPIIANDVFSIHCTEKSHDVWFGTGAGLLRMGRRPFLVPQVSSNIHCILEDSQGDLWLSTNRGLVQYSPSTSDAVTYGYSYGLGTIEYSDGASFVDQFDGRLYFGGINGFVSLSLTDYKEQNYSPDVLFREIRLADGIHAVNELLSSDGHLDISHKMHLAGVNIAALDYVNGSNYTYYARLHGYSDTWEESSAEFLFGDLPSGKYRLDVRYRNNITGVESRVYSLPIHLKPVWYASFLAKCIYVLIVLLMIAGVSGYWIVRYRARKREMQQKLEAGRKEEAYESKLRLFSNITQEFSQPLMMISAPCQEIVGYTKSDSFIMHHAMTISQNVAKLHDLIYMLNEFRGNGAEKEEVVELVEVAELVHGIADSFEDYLAKNHIHAKVDVAKRLVWPTENEAFSTIIDTLISESVRETPSGGAMEIGVETKEGLLYINAVHDGVGESPSEIAAVFDRDKVLDYFEEKSERGLSFQSGLRLAICHSLVTKLGGTIGISVENGNRTAFAVSLPKLTLTDPNASAPVRGRSKMSISAEQYSAPELPERQVPLTFEHDSSKPTVYIVDDGSDILRFVAELFARDYNITMSQGVEAMLELVKKNHPDVLICTSLNYETESIELIRAVKSGKLTSHIPVILISTAKQVKDNIKGVESGADICLALPFDVEYLRAVTNQLLRRNSTLKDYYKSTISNFSISEGKILHQEDKEFLDKMLDIIDGRITDVDLTTQSVADAMNMSPRNLYRRLSGLTDQTPAAIIKDLRLSKAEVLLRTTKLSIEEIIYKVGFANRGTFFKSFTAKYGSTPRAYRDQRLSEVHSSTM